MKTPEQILKQKRNERYYSKKRGNAVNVSFKLPVGVFESNQKELLEFKEKLELFIQLLIAEK